MNLVTFLGSQPWAVLLHKTQMIALEQELTFFNILNDCACNFSHSNIQLQFGDENFDSYAFEMMLAIDKTQARCPPGLFLSMGGNHYFVEHTAIEELSFPKPSVNFLSSPSARIKFCSVTIHITVLNIYPDAIAIEKLAAAAVSMNRVLKPSLLMHTITSCRCTSTSFRSNTSKIDDFCSFSTSPLHPLHQAHAALHSWMETLKIARYLLQPVMSSSELRRGFISSQAPQEQSDQNSSLSSRSRCCLVSLPYPFSIPKSGPCAEPVNRDLDSRNVGVDTNKDTHEAAIGHPMLLDLMSHLGSSMLFFNEYKMLEEKCLSIRDSIQNEVCSLLSTMYDDSSGSTYESQEKQPAVHIQERVDTGPLECEVSMASELCDSAQDNLCRKRTSPMEEENSFRKRLRCHSPVDEEKVC